MNNFLTTSLQKAFKNSDDKWIIRRRKINTSCIFDILTKSCVSTRGIRHVLQLNNEDISSPAIHKARKRLPIGIFKEINNYIQRGPHEPRIFAVDGSKVHVHPSFLKKGYVSRTNGKGSRKAKRPLVMLSSMVDVKTKTCVDFEITKHFNERTSAINMMKSIRPKDTMVFDRGYYSSNSTRFNVLVKKKKHEKKGINGSGGHRTLDLAINSRTLCH